MPAEAAADSKSAEPMLRSAAAFRQFQEWKAKKDAEDAKKPPMPEYVPPPKDPATDPFNLKEDPRSRWPLEVMGCSRTTHKSHYYYDSYPLTRNSMYAQFGKASMQQYMKPGQPHADYVPPPGAAIFSTRPDLGHPLSVPYLSLSYTPSRSDGK